MLLEWNKVTKYSKFLAIVLFLLTFYVGFLLGNGWGREKEKENRILLPNDNIEVKETNPTPAKPSTESPISIKTENIKEANFTGTMPTFSGSGPLVSAARTFVKEKIAEFKTEADKDVPDMREKFGADSPTANYTIDIGATSVKGEKTESLVITVYAYTGGANGNSSYKVITASKANGNILSLSDVVMSDKRTLFTEYVKKELNNWRPDTDAPVVFPDEVSALKFDSFTNWSLDDKNLTIYFDKYEIGPGYLGAVAFPISLEKIKDFLK